MDLASAGFLIAHNGLLRYVNPAFARMHGVSCPETMLGEPLGQRIAAGGRASFLERARCSPTDPAIDEPYETVGLRSDGTMFPVVATLSTVRVGEGHATIGCFEDISARRTAAASLSQAARLFAAVNGSHDGILFADANAVILYRSPFFAGHYGYADDERLGRSGWDMVHPDDLPAVRRAWTRMLSAPGQTLNVEYRIRHADGRWLSADSSIRNLLHDPAVGAVVINTRDITDRKRAESERDMLYRAIENSGEAIFATAVDGTFTYVNGEFTRMYGYSSEDVVGRASPLILDPSLRPRNEWGEDGLKDALLGGQRILADQVNRRRDGTLIHVRGSVSPILDGESRPVGFLGVHRDVTERRRLEAERLRLQQHLMQAQRLDAVGRLAGGIAHDFNNMLTVILASTDLITASLDRTHPVMREIAEIQIAAERSAALTHQLLAFARQQTAERTTLDVNDGIQATLSMLRRLLGDGVTLNWRPGPHVPPILIDRSQFDQVLINLSVNGRDAMAGTGTLTIESSVLELHDAQLAARAGVVPGRFAAIVVSDTGCGMDEGVRAHVFEPFFTTKPRHVGTGLGLATVYGIVKQHGGGIDVTSRVGEGTSFTLLFPVSDGLPASNAGEPSPPPSLIGNETILVVDDEAILLTLMVRVLTGWGYTVLSAGSTADAVEFMRTRGDEIDLLLTDVILPEGNGRDLARLLTAMKPALKVIYMSGYTADVIERHGVLSEGVDFVEKPWSSARLGETLRAVLDRP